MHLMLVHHQSGCQLHLVVNCIFRRGLKFDVAIFSPGYPVTIPFAKTQLAARTD
jgi:hypothetical protein